MFGRASPRYAPAKRRWISVARPGLAFRASCNTGRQADICPAMIQAPAQQVQPFGAAARRKTAAIGLFQIAAGHQILTGLLPLPIVVGLLRRCGAEHEGRPAVFLRGEVLLFLQPPGDVLGFGVRAAVQCIEGHFQGDRFLDRRRRRRHRHPRDRQGAHGKHAGRADCGCLQPMAFGPLDRRARQRQQRLQARSAVGRCRRFRRFVG